MVRRIPATRGPVTAKAGGRVRIIGGTWKRRLIDVVDAPGLRPTPDRVRETVFNWLQHLFGGDLSGRSMLDLFAGSGALGFEAASRGAAPVVLVESNPEVVAALTVAREALKADEVQIRSGRALDLAAAMAEAGVRFDVVFLDPPFGSGALEDALPWSHILAGPAGYVYVEAGSPIDVEAASKMGFAVVRADKAGDVFYHLLQRNKKNDEETPC